MKLRYLNITDAAELTHVYNEQLTHVPHCYHISPEEYEAGFPYRKYTRESYCEDIHSEKLIVAEQNGKTTGFADVAVAEIEENGQKDRRGFIRFLTYQPGLRPAGQALLAESEEYLHDLGLKRINAFRLNFRNDHGGYRVYHLGYSLISDKMGHICALFSMNGYEKNGGEIFMDQPGYSVPEPVLPSSRVEIRVKQVLPKQAVLPGLEVRAYYRNGKEMGFCESISAGEFCKADETQDWVFIAGLYVTTEEQGKGWGRYLLQRNLWEMLKAGYKNTAISTDWRNYRAQLFYTNYGYRVVDTCYEFVKNI